MDVIQSKYYTDSHTRQIIDGCLHKINALNAQMIGTDSTDKERADFLIISKQYRDTIKLTDPEFYKEVFYDKYD